jgi:glutamate racemase
MDGPIGVFDSGLGGLSILRELRRLLPFEDVLYVADQAHIPFGPRPLQEVREYAMGITRFLLDQGAKLVVVACNTASAAALHALRAEFPHTPFVGMEPAVKPAALSSKTRKVGVLATPATFQGQLYASVVERFAQGVEIHAQTVPGLVEAIEGGDLDGPYIRQLINPVIRRLASFGVDTLVLACTHYPLALHAIREVAGPRIQVIDPAPAIARQAQRLLLQADLLGPSTQPGQVTYASTRDAAHLAQMAESLISVPGSPLELRWQEGTLRLLGRR